MDRDQTELSAQPQSFITITVFCAVVGAIPVMYLCGGSAGKILAPLFAPPQQKPSIYNASGISTIMADHGTDLFYEIDAPQIIPAVRREQQYRSTNPAD